MKKIIFLAFFLVFNHLAKAQLLKIGARVGVGAASSQFNNLTFNENQTDYVLLKEGKAKMGVHVGLMAQIKTPILPLIIQPELLFSTSGSEIEIEKNGDTQKADINFTKLDIPVMVGVRAGAARFYAGPVASVILSENSELSEKVGNVFDKETYKSSTIGYQAGIGVNIAKKIALDLKYESNLTKWGESISIFGEQKKFDSRTSQFLLSVGYLF
jgi:opacity protein-like surface antigen